MNLPNTSNNFIQKYRTPVVMTLSVLTTTLLVVAALLVSSPRGRSLQLPPHTLTVNVKNIKTQEPITSGSVEVVLDGSRIFLRQYLDSSGSAQFRVNTGAYTIRMASGYSGQTQLRINSNYVVPLEVIPNLN